MRPYIRAHTRGPAAANGERATWSAARGPRGDAHGARPATRAAARPTPAPRPCPPAAMPSTTQQPPFYIMPNPIQASRASLRRSGRAATREAAPLPCVSFPKCGANTRRRHKCTLFLRRLFCHSEWRTCSSHPSRRLYYSTWVHHQIVTKIVMWKVDRKWKGMFRLCVWGWRCCRAPTCRRCCLPRRWLQLTSTECKKEWDFRLRQQNIYIEKSIMASELIHID